MQYSFTNIYTTLLFTQRQNFLRISYTLAVSFCSYLTVLFPQKFPPQLDKPRYLEELLQSMQIIHGIAFDNLVEKRIIQNASQHAKATLRDISPGDTVYLQSRDTFNRKFSGPFEVLNKHSDVTFSIRLLNNQFAPTLKVHIDRIYKCSKRKDYLENFQTERFEPNTSLAPLQPMNRYNLRSRVLN